MYIQNKVICNRKVAILLATYNGEKFLAEQLDSLLRQTFQEFCIYIHDDGSKDKTIDILKDYQQRFPNHIVILDYPSQNGACNNFFSLLDCVEAPYYMFCDQDDIWHKEKVEKSLNAIILEEKRTPDIPLFTYCNLRIVDEKGKVLHYDFWDTCQLYPEMYKSLAHRVSFTIPGCTIAINHKTKEISGDHKAALMHDGWLMIRTLAEGGKLICVNEILMDYRQHSTNTVGVECCYKKDHFWTKLSKLRYLIKTHIKTYKMLHAAGYGSIPTYIINKIRENVVRYQIRRRKKRNKECTNLAVKFTKKH